MLADDLVGLQAFPNINISEILKSAASDIRD
jgi:hypothetical protein